MIRINEEQEAVTVSCDNCNVSEEIEANNFYDAISYLKNILGWFTVKSNNKYQNACCWDCRQEILKEQTSLEKEKYKYAQRNLEIKQTSVINR